MIYAFGAFGTGNLGDDAIFEGIKCEIPNVTQIYVNVPTYNKAICFSDIQDRKFFPQGGNELIIGGGGIFHSERAINDYIEFAGIAKRTNMKVTIRAVGLEDVNEITEAKVKTLFSKVDSISVRSQRSVEIAKSLGKEVSILKDFAYRLNSPLVRKQECLMPVFDEASPVVGIVMNGNYDLQYLLDFAEIVKACISNHLCNFLFIPHSRSYVSNFNNDIIAGEIIRSRIDIYHDDRLGRFKLLKIPDNPYQLFDIYNRIDACICGRYHAMIFSDMAKIPIFGLVHSEKMKSFFTESKNTQHYYSENIKDLKKPNSLIFNFLSRLKKFKSGLVGSM